MPTRATIFAGLGLTALAVGLSTASAQQPKAAAPQPGVAQQIGQAIDNAGRQVQTEAQSVTQTFDNARQQVQTEAKGVTQAVNNARQQVRSEARGVTQAVRQSFDQMAADVQRMGAVPRVYARLHWDKTLYNARIQVHPLPGGTVLLRGVVHTQAARKRAEELAASTVSVSHVVNELTVVASPVPPQPAASAARPAPIRR